MSAETSAATGLRSREILMACAALGGAAWFALEITAVRAVAPWIGTSTPVWSHIIVVVLAAGALGSLLGARLAQRADPAATAARICLLSGCWLAVSTALLPWIAECVAPPAGLAPPDARSGLLISSLALAFLLLGPPVLGLSTLTPILLRCGPVSFGALLCASTLGSLVPLVGIHGSLLNFAGPRGVLALVAFSTAVMATLLDFRNCRAGIGAMFLGVAVLLATSHGPDTRLWPDNLTDRELEVLALRESDYQHLHVSRVRTADGRTQRRMALDEGIGEFHSMASESAVLTGQYYDTLALSVAGSGAAQPTVLILGGGAGTLAALIHRTCGESAPQVTSIELDPAVIAGAGLLGFSAAEAGRMLAGDARRGLAQISDRFDVIVLDAFARQLAVPAHLFTREFLELVNRHLNPSGIFAVNVSAANLESSLMQALLSTLREQFATIEAVPVPGAWSVVLLCSPAARPLLPQTVPSALESVLADVRARWQPACDFTMTQAVLTDDRAPLERLAREH